MKNTKQLTDLTALGYNRERPDRMHHLGYCLSLDF